MDRHQFIYSKNSAKGNKEMVMSAIGSALNNTINDWIMLFGDSEEDVHLFTITKQHYPVIDSVIKSYPGSS